MREGNSDAWCVARRGPARLDGRLAWNRSLALARGLQARMCMYIIPTRICIPLSLSVLCRVHVPARLPTYLYACIPTYQHAYIPSYLLHVCISTYLHLHTYQHVYIGLHTFRYRTLKHSAVPTFRHPDMQHACTPSRICACTYGCFLMHSCPLRLPTTAPGRALFRHGSWRTPRACARFRAARPRVVRVPGSGDRAVRGEAEVRIGSRQTPELFGFSSNRAYVSRPPCRILSFCCRVQNGDSLLRAGWLYQSVLLSASLRRRS